MIKPFLCALVFASTLMGADKLSALSVRMEGKPLLTFKLFEQTLQTMGVSGDIRHFSSDTETTEIILQLTGKKGYDPRRFVELLKERSVGVIASKFENQKWHFDLDMREAVLEIPQISEDSSAQMQRSVYPYWFEVGSTRYISIEAPYEGTWYPEIGVLNDQMEVLHSSKQAKPQERMEFELPEGSKYLKVSNSHGMHLMKEGLWVSAEQNEN